MVWTAALAFFAVQTSDRWIELPRAADNKTVFIDAYSMPVRPGMSADVWVKFVPPVNSNEPTETHFTRVDCKARTVGVLSAIYRGPGAAYDRRDGKPYVFPPVTPEPDTFGEYMIGLLCDAKRN